MENLIGVQFLLPSEVIELHDELIDLYGGEAGINDYNLFESAVEAPKHVFDGAFVYSTIHLMAAALLRGLACNHGFVDGNKRTAARAVFVFYNLNGFLFDPPEDDWVEFVVSVVLEKPSLETIAQVLQRYCLPLPIPE